MGWGEHLNNVIKDFSAQPKVNVKQLYTCVEPVSVRESSLEVLEVDILWPRWVARVLLVEFFSELRGWAGARS